MRPWLRLAAASALALGAGAAPVAACGGDQGLVGGDCATGYARCGNDCCPVKADATVADGSRDGARDGSKDGPSGEASDGAPFDRFPSDRGFVGDGADDGGDGGAVDGSPADSTPGETGPGCMPPTPDDCNGVCTDTTSDPLNCGTCGNVCPSQICVNSMCVGSTAGGVVYIGHDYLTTVFGTAQARVLSNAVLVPQDNPLHVLSYERYANATAVSRVKAIVSGAAVQLGRGVQITSTTTDGDIPSKLTWSAYQVLIVQDQPSAPSGALATLGTSWAATLATFTQAGGIVVVLDGGTGVGEMPAFSTGTGLLAVSADLPIATGTQLLDVAPGDVVGVGVVSPYGAGKNSVGFTSEPNGGSVIYVVELPSDAGTPSPVVVHKVF